jgi:hypothetical protein
MTFSGIKGREGRLSETGERSDVRKNAGIN